MLKIGINFWMKLLSLPSWERGLKLSPPHAFQDFFMSLPSWERGLKWSGMAGTTAELQVAPLVGAWIEMIFMFFHLLNIWSLPSWERGLKSLSVTAMPLHPASRASWERGLK